MCCGRRWDSAPISRSRYTVITSVTNSATTLIAIALIDKDRPQAAAADRLHGHGCHAGDDGRDLRHRAYRPRRRQGTTDSAGRPGPIALIAANLFVVAFGMSWGPVVWVLLGEMFPNRIRAAALGLAAAGQWAANWAITVSFPALRHHAGPGVWLLRAVCCAVVPVRLAVGGRDQGQDAGGHARRSVAPRTPRGLLRRPPGLKPA